MTEPDPTAAAIDAAADALYGAPLSAFTTERKRLADALRAGGQRAAAAAVAKLPRPQMSAWAVNRLYREARDDVDRLLAAGARLRAGDSDGRDEQRAALARLRARAAQILVGDEHAASPATLQRIATTLQALSATGTFAPDAPGRLIGDRDPPGFEVIAAAPPPARPHLTLVPAPPDLAPLTEEEAHREREARAAFERAEADRLAREHAAERLRNERAAAAATLAVSQRTAEVTALRKNLDAALVAIDNLRERLRGAEAALAEAEARAAAAAAALDG